MAMKKKNSTSNSLGVCEKIFNAIRVGPAIQKIRHISYCPRESVPHAGGKTIEIHAEEDADPDHGYQEPAQKIEFLSTTPNDHQKVISSTTKVGQEDGRLAISAPVKEKPKPKAQPEKVVVGQSHGQVAAIAKVGSKVEPQGQTHKKGVVVSQEQSSHGGREVKFVSKSGEEKNLTKSKGHGKPAFDDQDINIAASINEGNKKQGVDHLNDAFSAYINRKKIQIRAESDEGKNTWGSLDGEHHDGNKKESLKDHFSDYIHRAKVKMVRSSSSFGTGKKNLSFKKE